MSIQFIQVLALLGELLLKSAESIERGRKKKSLANFSLLLSCKEMVIGKLENGEGEDGIYLSNSFSLMYSDSAAASRRVNWSLAKQRRKKRRISPNEINATIDSMQQL